MALSRFLGALLPAVLLLLLTACFQPGVQGQPCGTTDQCGGLPGSAAGSPNSVNQYLCQSGALNDCSTDGAKDFHTVLKLQNGQIYGRFIYGYPQSTNLADFVPGDCCSRCRADPSCDAWNFQIIQTSPTTYQAQCFVITSSGCVGAQSVYREGSAYTYTTWYTGSGGTDARARCQNPGTSSGCLDPHFVIQTSSGLASQDFTFDFHGLANKIYCMVTDIALQLNVRMFEVPPTSKVIERKSDLGDDFFTGTWMEAIGFVHISKDGARDKLTIELDHNKARNGGFPFRVVHNEEDLTELLVSREGATWTSQDGRVTISRSPDNVSILNVDVKGVLNMVASVETEEEIIVDPPIYFVNFQLKDIVTTPSVHGFLGQMFAPGAIEERLAMGTLEGLRHREYVEGTDGEYETSDLTATDCSFNRFNDADNTDASVHKSRISSNTAFNRRLLERLSPVDAKVTGLASPSGCHMVNKKRLGAISISCETNGL